MLELIIYIGLLISIFKLFTKLKNKTYYVIYFYNEFITFLRPNFLAICLTKFYIFTKFFYSFLTPTIKLLSNRKLYFSLKK